MRLGTRSLVGVMVLSLLVTACGSDATEDGVDDGGLAAETGAAGTSGGDTSGGGASPPTTGSTGDTGIEDGVQVSLNNYLFDPDPLQVISGDVITVRNANTKTPHTFTVVGQDVDLELGPLETETVEIALEAGTYELICRFHEAQDMSATLVVT